MMNANLPTDDFSATPFYQEREAAILGLLDRCSLAFPETSNGCASADYELSNVIYLAGCVAGSYGIPLDSDSVRERLSFLYSYACPDRWPEISRLLSELYAHCYAGYLCRLKTGFLLKRNQKKEAPVVLRASQRKSSDSSNAVGSGRKARRASHSATRRS